MSKEMATQIIIVKKSKNQKRRQKLQEKKKLNAAMKSIDDLLKDKEERESVPTAAEFRRHMENQDTKGMLETLEAVVEVYSRGGCDHISRERCVEGFRQQGVRHFLVLPLAFSDQKRIAAVVMKIMLLSKNEENYEARALVAEGIFDFLFSNAPRIPDDATILSLASKQLDDDATDSILKSTFFSVLYVLSDAYIQQAIAIGDEKWSEPTLLRIRGLLQPHTAKLLCEKLSKFSDLVDDPQKRICYKSTFEKVQTKLFMI